MSGAPAPAGTAASSRGVRLTIAIALAAAAVRLIPLQFLHPLQWDELEFFRATSWIAEGRLPYRDFWEHHTPLGWYLFAPVTWLIDGEGVGAVIAMRWAQVPLWIATFALLNFWMKGAGIGKTARWAAIAFALASSFFMIAAVEYRVDTVGCFLVVAGLVLAQRNAFFLGGAVFCLAGFANLRLGPMLVVAAIALRLAYGAKANRLFAGGLAALAMVTCWFAATGSLQEMWQQVVVENRLGDAYATRVGGSLAHRLLSPFGVRLLASDRLFEPAGIDPGAIALLLFGFAGVVLALRRWRESAETAAVAAVQVASLAFIGSMKFIYNYHFEIVVVLMVPLAALAVDRTRLRGVVAVFLAAALGVSVFASLFRGKELDRAYQDRIMREVHARTEPGEIVLSGAAWPIRREPAYRFWFLPDLARQLVARGHAAPYVMQRPPAAIVFDHNLLVWLTQVQTELIPGITRHYVPVWRNLLVPALNGRLGPEGRLDWVVGRSGVYHLHVSSGLARHPWFREPIRTTAYKGADAGNLTVRLGEPAGDDRVRWEIDGAPATVGATVGLREGQRVTAISAATEPLAVILIGSPDRLLFRQPPPGVSIDAEAPRVTHVPVLRARLEP